MKGRIFDVEFEVQQHSIGLPAQFFTGEWLGA
jgi:hypothetical protein